VFAYAVYLKMMSKPHIQLLDSIAVLEPAIGANDTAGAPTAVLRAKHAHHAGDFIIISLEESEKQMSAKQT